MKKSKIKVMWALLTALTLVILCTFTVMAKGGAGMIGESDGDLDGDGVVEGPRVTEDGLLGGVVSDAESLVRDASDAVSEGVSDAASGVDSMMSDSSGAVSSEAVSSSPASSEAGTTERATTPAATGNASAGGATTGNSDGGSSALTWVIVALIAAAVVVILTLVLMPKNRRR